MFATAARIAGTGAFWLLALDGFLDIQDRLEPCYPDVDVELEVAKDGGPDVFSVYLDPFMMPHSVYAREGGFVACDKSFSQCMDLSGMDVEIDVTGKENATTLDLDRNRYHNCVFRVKMHTTEQRERVVKQWKALSEAHGRYLEWEFFRWRRPSLLHMTWSHETGLCKRLLNIPYGISTKE